MSIKDESVLASEFVVALRSESSDFDGQGSAIHNQVQAQMGLVIGRIIVSGVESASLFDLDGVHIDDIEDGQFIYWNESNGRFEPVTVDTDGGVVSVFGRTGVVTAQSGDYSVGQVTGAEATANKGSASGYASLDSTTKVPVVQMGTGTASSSTWLRGDRQWATPSHSDISNLSWESSGHTGSNNTIGGFNGSGSAENWTLSTNLQKDGASLKTTEGFTFVPIDAEPSSLTLWVDDGSNYVANTMVWDNHVIVGNSIDVGGIGNEQGSIRVDSTDTSVRLRGTSLGGQPILLNLHQHSNSSPAEMVFSRSAANGAPHSVVSDGVELGSQTFVGWSGSGTVGYLRAARIRALVDGSVSSSEMPGRLELLTSPSGSKIPQLGAYVSSEQVLGSPRGIELGDGSGTSVSPSDLIRLANKSGVLSKSYDGGSWEPILSGPTSSTNNAFALFNGTDGDTVKNSDWLSVTGTYSSIAYQQLRANGSSSNVTMVISPKGTGGIQSRVADGAATGGNNRGVYAIDLQLSRALATQVASGNYSTISGGQSNTAPNPYGAIGGGRLNTIEASDCAIAGGWLNVAKGVRNFIGGGYSNETDNQDSTVAGGRENKATNLRSFVGGGYLNKSTSIYSVTVGGFTNDSKGNYSFIGGGGSNTAEGVYSIVVGGVSNSSEGDYSYIGGGGSNYTQGNYTTVLGGFQCGAVSLMATVVGGNQNVASGDYSIVSGGQSNTSSGDYSFSSGFSCVSDKDYCIASGHSAVSYYPRSSTFSSGNISSSGDSNTAKSVVSRQTTNDSPTVLTTGSGSPTTLNTFVLPQDSAVMMEVSLVLRSSGHHAKYIKMYGVFVRRDTEATVNQQAANQTSDGHAALASATANFTINTTNGSVDIEVTGIVDTTIRWVADVKLVTTKF